MNTYIELEYFIFDNLWIINGKIKCPLMRYFLSEIMSDQKYHGFIVGEKIELLPCDPTKLTEYHKWSNNAIVRIYERDVFPETPEERRKHIFPENRPDYPEEIFFDIWHKSDKKLIGAVGLHHISAIHRNAMIGLGIGDPNYWNLGIGCEAAKLIIDFGFAELNLHKIKAGIFAPNLGSQQCALKNGMHLEMTMRDDVFVNGIYHDAFFYAIFEEEWRKLRGI